MDTRIWAWIIGIIVVIGIVWYVMSGPSSAMAPTPVGTSTTTTDMGTTGGSGYTGTSPTTAGTPAPQTVGFGSANDLVALKKNLTCSIDMAVGTGRRSGTLYVSSGLMRGDFVSTTAGKTQVVSMIDNGSSLYLWNNQSTTGITLTAGTGAAGSAMATRGGIDPAVDFAYVCHPWQPDPSFFVPSADITYATS